MESFAERLQMFGVHPGFDGGSQPRRCDETMDCRTLAQNKSPMYMTNLTRFLDFSHSEVTVTEWVQELTLAHKPLGIRFASRASCSSRSTVRPTMPSNEFSWMRHRCFMDLGFLQLICLVWARFERGRAMERTPDTLTRLEKTQRRTPVWTSMLGIFRIGKMA